jgi:hypothetical protein
VDAEGNIHLEGIGVVPTVRVPVTEETLFSDGDPILEAAIAHLDAELAYDILDSGSLQVGDVVTVSMRPNARLHYTITLPAGTYVSIFAEADGTIDPVLNLYDETGENVLLSNDDMNEETLNAALEELEVGEEDFNVIIEVATVNDLDQGTLTLRIVDVTADA